MPYFIILAYNPLRYQKGTSRRHKLAVTDTPLPSSQPLNLYSVFGLGYSLKFYNAPIGLFANTLPHELPCNPTIMKSLIVYDFGLIEVYFKVYALFVRFGNSLP
ncbi:MAG TPA: hypothetical protein G4O06_04015 [Dehalococcoidia bacterium]|nr:hypothetical protein [Dehalococcoidia bacterium]